MIDYEMPHLHLCSKTARLLMKVILYDYNRRLLNSLLNIIYHVSSKLDQLAHVTSHDNPTYCCIQHQILPLYVCRQIPCEMLHVMFTAHTSSSHYGTLCMACTHGEKRNAYGVLVEEPEGKRPLGIYRHRWEDNIMVYRPVARQRPRNIQRDNGCR
jgi:hypothetical protein